MVPEKSWDFKFIDFVVLYFYEKIYM